jgi:hypothetical protein
MKTAGDAIVRLASIIGKPTLQKRVDALKARMTGNPVLDNFLRQEYSTELAIERFLHRRRTTGRWPTKVRDEATAVTLSFAFLLTEVHRRLSPKGRTDLERRLYGSLKGENSLAPIVHEMTVACHLMNRHWDVEFHDLEEGGGFDYFARNGLGAIEVECKRASADAGRKIHRDEFGRFAGPLLPALWEFAPRGTADLVHMRIKDRLPKGEPDLLPLRKAAFDAMNTTSAISGDTFKVDIAKVGLSHPSFGDEAVMRKEVERYLGTKHFHLIYAVKGAHVTALAVTSDKGDRILSHIYGQLKHAAEQFSRQRPAVVWTYIEGVQPEEWEGLIGDTALQRMSNRYMLGQARQHVFSMAYSSTGHLVARDGHFQHTGPLMNYNRGEPEFKKLSRMLYG